MYQKIVEILNNHKCSYEAYEHEPIRNYEDAYRVAKQFNWQGSESKNIVLKNKRGQLYIYVTLMGKQFDKKHVIELIGEKLSICSREEVLEKTQVETGCIPPFGFDDTVIYLVDPEVFQQEVYLFSPGVFEKTFIISGQDLKWIFDGIENPIHYL